MSRSTGWSTRTRETRRVLARMAADAFRAGQKVWITANNKAEGSAPLSLLKLAEEIAKLLLA